MRIQLKDLEGREHLVVPMVMIVEGVLNGSDGPFLYPASELQKNVHLWNGKPVVVYHPDIYAEYLANSPAVFNKQKVGVVFRARYENRRIKAEAWLDVARLNVVDKRVLHAVQRGQMVEVSTGLYLQAEDRAGFWQGKRYKAIARNYSPDHLAILPDLKGACSIADGAGLCRNQHYVEEPLLSPSCL